MRIIRFVDTGDNVCLGSELDSGVIELLRGSLFDPADPLTPPGQTAALPPSLLSPIEPVNIFCIGLNYVEHARESGAEIPKHPVLFMKSIGALNHPGGRIRIPSCQMAGPEVDYECELAVVIGKAARNVTENDALDYVLGYTCGNDVSARKWQKNTGGQWVRGKSFDTFCPLGPALVTTDEIPDPQTLHLSTTLNGQIMQDNNTSDMIFPVRKLISFMSQDTTLLPGSVILTGTPQGVGFARKPPVWLKAGDEVVVEVEKIGQLKNTVVE